MSSERSSRRRIKRRVEELEEQIEAEIESKLKVPTFQHGEPTGDSFVEGASESRNEDILQLLSVINILSLAFSF